MRRPRTVAAALRTRRSKAPRAGRAASDRTPDRQLQDARSKRDGDGLVAAQEVELSQAEDRHGKHRRPDHRELLE